MHIKLPTQKIQLPKNKIKLLTVNKNGEQTKEKTITNTWTHNGFRHFWFTSRPQDAQFTGSKDGIGAANNDGFTLCVSDGTDIIDYETVDLSGVKKTTSTNVPTRNGLSYPNCFVENINGSNYWKFTILKAFAFGEIDFDVTQVGATKTGNVIYCGTRLDDGHGNITPFSVTSEEQLLVEYSFFVPENLILQYPLTLPDVPVVDVVTVNKNGNPAEPIEITFRKKTIIGSFPAGSGIVTIRLELHTHAPTTQLAQQYMIPYITFTDTNDNAIVTLTGTDSTVTTTHFDNYKKMRTVFSWNMPPASTGVAEIAKAYHYSTRLQSTGSDNGAMLILEFNPPLEKGVDDRVAMSYEYVVELDEVDF